MFVCGFNTIKYLPIYKDTIPTLTTWCSIIFGHTRFLPDNDKSEIQFMKKGHCDLYCVVLLYIITSFTVVLGEGGAQSN